MKMNKNWYFFKSGDHFGPFSEKEIIHLLALGKLSEKDLLWKEGDLNWKPLIEHEEFRKNHFQADENSHDFPQNLDPLKEALKDHPQAVESQNDLSSLPSLPIVEKQPNYKIEEFHLEDQPPPLPIKIIENENLPPLPTTEENEDEHIDTKIPPTPFKKEDDFK